MSVFCMEPFDPEKTKEDIQIYLYLIKKSKDRQEKMQKLNDKIQEMKDLINVSGDYNALDSNKKTFLHYAIEYGLEELQNH